MRRRDMRHLLSDLISLREFSSAAIGLRTSNTIRDNKKGGVAVSHVGQCPHDHDNPNGGDSRAAI